MVDDITLTSERESLTSTQLGDYEILTGLIQSIIPCKLRYVEYVYPDDPRTGECVISKRFIFGCLYYCPIRLYGVQGEKGLVIYALQDKFEIIEPRVESHLYMGIIRDNKRGVSDIAIAKVDSTIDQVRDGSNFYSNFRAALGDNEEIVFDDETGTTTWYLKEDDYVTLENGDVICGVSFHPITQLHGKESVKNHGSVQLLTLED